MSIKRTIIIVIDGCGVGELPDATNYNDSGASTLSNCATAVGGVYMPHCRSLGLGNITSIQGVSSNKNPIGSFGKMAELSQGKDSTIGHWEISGIVTTNPFPTYPNGFPSELITKFEKEANVKTVGNITASGTEIIDRLGEHHLKTKEIIMYTSADSVLQLASHEDIYSKEELYKICETARKVFIGENTVGRVIARPFNGTVGNFKRTVGRKDFSVKPPKETILDLMHDNHYKTMAIGKIYDLFNGSGISSKVKTKSNIEGLQAIINSVNNDTTHQLIFANLVDFDEHCGHRRDPMLFAQTLEQFDKKLGEVIRSLRLDDLLIITADHGCDPTFTKHTDHTREYVPLLVYNKKKQTGVNLGSRNSFADIAKTIADIFHIENTLRGQSFKEMIQL